MSAAKSSTELWPALSTPAFEPTRHLLHMVLQAVAAARNEPKNLPDLDEPALRRAPSISRVPNVCFPPKSRR